jgi:transmembrane 9 superfamily protein 3
MPTLRSRPSATHRGYVGELEAKSINFARAVDNTTKYHLFTHLDFSVSYNQDRIIEVNVTSDPLQRVDLSTAVGHKVRPRAVCQKP